MPCGLDILSLRIGLVKRNPAYLHRGMAFKFPCSYWMSIIAGNYNLTANIDMLAIVNGMSSVGHDIP